MFQTPELDVNKEIYDLLMTDTDCTPISKPIIHREIQVDDKGNLIRCPSCNYKNSGFIEGIPDCPYCHGVGFQWKESIQTGWIFKPNIRTAFRSYDYPEPVGRDIDKQARLLTLPDVVVKERDLIYEIKMDKNKDIEIPLKYNQIYTCFFSEKLASDQSDSEFNLAGLKI